MLVNSDVHTWRSFYSHYPQFRKALSKNFGGPAPGRKISKNIGLQAPQIISLCGASTDSYRLNKYICLYGKNIWHVNVIFRDVIKVSLIKASLSFMETNTRVRKCQSFCAMLFATLLSQKVISASSVHRLILVLFSSLSSYFLPPCCCVFLSFICLRPKNKTVYFFFTVSVTVPSVYFFFVSSFLILYFVDNSILLT